MLKKPKTKEEKEMEKEMKKEMKKAKKDKKDFIEEPSTSLAVDSCSS